MRNRFWGDLITAVTVIVAVALPGVVGTGTAAAAAQDAMASLTIHRRVCPPGVSGPNLYESCHELPQTPGVELSLLGAEERTERTDAAGDVVFADLTPGAYLIRDSEPGGDFTGRQVFCSSADSPGTQRPAGLGSIILAPGDEVVCDWYITNPDPSARAAPGPTPSPAAPLPAGTTLTIASWLCPENLESADYEGECRETPGPDFRFWTAGDPVAEAAVAGEDGTVHLDLAGLPAGQLSLFGTTPEEATEFYAAVVSCSAGDTPLPVTPISSLSTYHLMALPVAPGDEIRCDWHHIPYLDDQEDSE